ncbi:MAG TPA: hypothetical protein PLZ44_08675 [Methanothrix sp.]|nr:hypothetical protein [Methanothrix sp.]
MTSSKCAIIILATAFLALAFIASAQWSPGGSMVYMGDLNLQMSSFSSGEQTTQTENAIQNETNPTNSTLNETNDNSTVTAPVSLDEKPATSDASSTGSSVLDLSGYAQNRVKNNLTGYMNIMYPISGSRGTTTSTAGGAGSCGGCG